MSRKIKWDYLPVVLCLTAFCIFFISFQHYDFDYSMYAMDRIEFGVDYILLTIFRIICGVSGIILSTLIIRTIITFPTLSKIIALLGTITLPIYVMHQKILIINTFFPLNICQPSFQIIIAAGVTIVTAMFYLFARKFKMLSLLLFGENKYRVVDKWIYQ